jgi:hypothetical protein
VIGKQVKGKSFRGLLNYLFGKEGARQIGSNMERTNPKDLAVEFRFSQQLNPKTKRAVYHASLSLPHNDRVSVASRKETPTIGDRLSDETWHEIAQKYLRAMNFDMNQYVVVRHTDRTHDHVHIAASRIKLDGTTVSDSWDYRHSEAVIRKLEQEYNLQSVQGSREKDSYSPTTGERRQLARTGEESVRVKLQQAIDHITQDHPTMPELIKRLQQQGVNIRVSYTSINKVKGISYKLDGVAFSGTHLGKAYTFPGLQKHRSVNYSSQRDDKLIQQLMKQPAENLTLTAFTKQDDKPLQVESTDKNTTSIVLTEQDNKRLQIEQTDKNLTSSTQQVNNLPTPEPANWEQVRLKLSQQYNLPDSLLSEMYQKGWLYASKTGQPVFVERTLNDIPTQAKVLEPTGYFTPIPLTSEPTKNGSFWLATDTIVKRAVLLSDPIEVLSVVALESTVDQKQRKPTLYWSVGDSEQVPWEFLRSLETVTIAFPTEHCENGERFAISLKDNEKTEDLVSKILAELPQAKRVSPSQTSWNGLLKDSKWQLDEQHYLAQSQGWEL